MMKENIKPITNNDAEVEFLYQYIIKMYLGTKWEDLLIYYDPNYRAFLTTVISAEHNKFYWLCRGDRNIGFAHLVVRQDELYLNNIFIDENYRSKGLGSLFLNLLIRTSPAMEKFSLNVFSSNSGAHRWYSNLGMRPVISTHYYQLHTYKPGYKYDVKYDGNGFTGLYSENRKVATIIKNENVIFHNIDDAVKGDLADYKIILIRTADAIVHQCITLYDESILMSIEREKLTDKLKNLK